MQGYLSGKRGFEDTIGDADVMGIVGMVGVGMVGVGGVFFDNNY